MLKINKNSTLSNWNKIYKTNKQFSIWPWSDLVSLSTKFCNLKKNIEVLEIGCGVGANINFFLSKNCNYTGIDISSYAINYLKKFYKNTNVNLFDCNYINYDTKKKYDLIIDRCAITCGNNTLDIKKILSKINFDLKKNGKFIGIDWYSKNTSFFQRTNKNKNFISYYGLGKIYFSNLVEIKYFLNKFKILYLQEKHTLNILDKKKSISFWSFVCKKFS